LYSRDRHTGNEIDAVCAQSGSWLTASLLVSGHDQNLYAIDASGPSNGKFSWGESSEHKNFSGNTDVGVFIGRLGDSPGIGNGVPRAALESNDEAQS